MTQSDRADFHWRPGWFGTFMQLALVCLVTSCGSEREADEVIVPAPIGYVTSDTCAACHRQQFGDWTGSHHDLAMQEASVEAVLGDFEDATFTHFGVTSRFFREGSGFFVNTEGPEGTLSDFEIAYTFGVEPLQQYLIEFPGGRLQTLSIAWDTERRRWFHLYPEERILPEDPLHWTRPYQNWNFMCAECHSTNLQKNYDLETRTYDTSWEEIDVGCEACHGPGQAHIEWAGDREATGAASDGRDLGLTVNFSDSDSFDQVDSCAPCHSRRHQVSTGDQPDEPFLDHFMPELLREDLYHPDGQILGEVYVYGSFLQSPMYGEGVRCSDCHNPHNLNLRVLGNAVCEQCHHPDAPKDRFPSLTAKDYDSPEHHFHPAESAGAECVNCHMPAKTYMGVDPRRDHSFRIPRPDVSVTLGTPNACNSCHLEETAEWASGAIVRWYGPDRRREPHYGEVLAAGRTGDPGAIARLIALADDSEQPGIVRATALELLGRYGAPGLGAFQRGLEDPDPIVRGAAVGAVEQLSPEERIGLLSPLLRDPFRSVRLEAARVLGPVPAALVNASDQLVLRAGLAEYERVQMSLGDTAAAHLNLGVIHAAAGGADRAVTDYQTALEIEAGFLPASLNLATLLNQLGRNPDAERVLRDAIELNPEEGELHYSFGLLLAEMNQLEGAATSLGRAADLLPQRPRVRYNYALALQQLDRREEAEAQLLETYRLGPEDPSVVQALAIFYAQEDHWDQAIQWAEMLVEMLPAQDGPRQFLEGIRSQRLER